MANLKGQHLEGGLLPLFPLQVRDLQRAELSSQHDCLVGEREINLGVGHPTAEQTLAQGKPGLGQGNPLRYGTPPTWADAQIREASTKMEGSSPLLLPTMCGQQGVEGMCQEVNQDGPHLAGLSNGQQAGRHAQVSPAFWSGPM